jgi:hypothetical protein
MRDIKMTQLIKKSIHRVKLILFSPISIKKWLVLLFIAVLAGALGGSGGGGMDRSAEETPGQQEVSVAQEAAPGAWGGGTDLLQDDIGQASDEEVNAEQGLAVIVDFVLMLVLFIALFLLFSWLVSRFRFIWLHSIVNNVSLIKEPWRKYRAQGNSFFKFSLVVALLGVLFFALVAGWAFLALSRAGALEEGFSWSLLTALQLLGLPVGLGFVGLFTVSMLMTVLEDFIIPIMATAPCRVKEAFRKFGPIYRANQKDFWLYVFVKAGLWIASVLIVLVAFGIIIIVTLLLGGIIFGLGYLLFWVLLKVQIVFWIYAILIGIPFAAVAILCLMAVQLPLAMFFRSFSLYFFSSLKSGYTPLPLQEPSD